MNLRGLPQPVEAVRTARAERGHTDAPVAPFDLPAEASAARGEPVERAPREGTRTTMSAETTRASRGIEARGGDTKTGKADGAVDASTRNAGAPRHARAAAVDAKASRDDSTRPNADGPAPDAVTAFETASNDPQDARPTDSQREPVALPGDMLALLDASTRAVTATHPSVASASLGIAPGASLSSTAGIPATPGFATALTAEPGTAPGAPMSRTAAPGATMPMGIHPSLIGGPETAAAAMSQAQAGAVGGHSVSAFHSAGVGPLSPGSMAAASSARLITAGDRGAIAAGIATGPASADTAAAARSVAPMSAMSIPALEATLPARAESGDAFALETPTSGFEAAGTSTATARADAVNRMQFIAPIPVPVRPELGLDDVFDQRIVWMAEQRIGQAEMRVSPDGAGPIDVRLQVDGQRVTAQFHAASPEVRQALEAGMERLRDLLGQRGMELADAQVGQQRSHGERSSPGPGALAEGDAEPEGAPVVTTLRALRARGLVDEYA